MVHVRRMIVTVVCLLQVASAQLGYPVDDFVASVQGKRLGNMIMWPNAEGDSASDEDVMYLSSREGILLGVTYLADGSREDVETRLVDVIQRAAPSNTSYGALTRALRLALEDLDAEPKAFTAVPEYQVSLSKSGAEIRLQLGFKRFLAFPQPLERLGARGPVIRVFNDYECAACVSFQQTVFPNLKARYLDTNKASFSVVQLPSANAISRKAALYAVCASRQGKFFEFHDAYLVGPKSPLLIARNIGLEIPLLRICEGSSTAQRSLRADAKLAQEAGVHASPSVYVGSFWVPDYQDVSRYAFYIRLARLLDGPR